MSDSTLFSDPFPDLSGPLPEPNGGYLGPAAVVGVDGNAAGSILVELPDGRGRCRAEVAVPGLGRPTPGRRVLVSAGGPNETYVIGVLDRAPRQVLSREGGSATVVEHAEGERIEVRGPDRALLFEYDPGNGAARLHLPEGDVAVSAPNGDLNLSAGGAVRLTGRSIDLAASSFVRVFVHDAAARILNSIRLGRRGARIRAKRASLDAERAELEVERTRVTGERLDTHVSLIRTTAERIETVAESVTQRFGALCRRVTGLLETRAGRLRMLVSGAWHGRAERADLRTRETFKVDGDQIHLG